MVAIARKRSRSDPIRPTPPHPTPQQPIALLYDRDAVTTGCLLLNPEPQIAQRFLQVLQSSREMASFTRAGGRMLRALTKRGICITRTGLQQLQSQYICPFPAVQSFTKASDCTSFLARHHFSTDATNKEGSDETEEISVTFVDRDGEEKTIKVPIGWSILEAAHANDIDLEGACEASLACSTCHVIVMDVDHYNQLEEPTDEENDMLDLAYGLTETSRLGCQIIARRELDGIRLAIPSATRNFAVDGFIPKPH